MQFAYRKASKLVGSERNGRFRFDVGSANMLHDDDPDTPGKNVTVQLHKGLNELMWYYVVSTNLPHDDLFAEISVKICLTRDRG